MGLSLEIYMEKIGRNLVCNSFYMESEVVANISGSNTIKQIKKESEVNVMDMCYDGTLVLPSSYAVMDEEEMSYLEGGGTAVVYGTASQIRSRLTAIIGASLVGTGASAALGFLLGNVGGAIISTILGGGWFGSYRSCASKAHNQVESIIRKYGKSRKCKMTTTYSFAYMCTGVSVKVA